MKQESVQQQKWQKKKVCQQLFGMLKKMGKNDNFEEVKEGPLSRCQIWQQ